MHKSITAKRWDNPRLAKQAVAKKVQKVIKIKTTNALINNYVSELQLTLLVWFAVYLSMF